MAIMSEVKASGNEKMNRIKSFIVDRNISQKMLAAEVGKSEDSISRICLNQTQPSIKLLRKIAKALNVNVQELLEPTPVKPE